MMLTAEFKPPKLDLSVDSQSVGFSTGTPVAREYVEETGLLHNVPEMLQNYFDFEAYGRDMSYEGHFVFTNSGNCVQIY